MYVFDLATSRFSTLDVPNVLAAHNDVVTDTLYVVDGETYEASVIVPWFQTDPYTGTWRSKIAVRGSKPSFGWLRVNGDFATVDVNLYLNGALFHTDTFTNRHPKRVPVGRGREWEIEVVSTGVVTSVVLATDVKELL